MIVADASAVIAFLTDKSATGQFVAATVAATSLAYPSLLPYEVTNALRRLCQRGLLEPHVAQNALHRTNELGGIMFQFEELSDRAWQLRDNLTAYDAAYVALAELIDAPLLTFDHKLLAAPGTRCRFVKTPTDG